VRQRLRQHANPFNVRGDIAVTDLTALFGRAAPLALDVGFGLGGFTLELARRHPEWNVLGLEIREVLIERLTAAAVAQRLTNVRALLANANLHLHRLVPAHSVVFVALNFPDPWYKKRHHKRRVVRADWIQLLADKLLPGGELHISSDFEPLAREIDRLLRSAPGFVSPDDGFAPHNTTGIVSERESKHLRRGDPIYRLRFRFQPDSPASLAPPAPDRKSG